MTSWIDVDGHTIKITNPEKLLWPEMDIRKADYLKVLIELSPYLLPYTKDRNLMIIRYPNGIHEHSFYQKNRQEHTPDWIDSLPKGEDASLNLNSRATLLWLGNSGALEFHIGFEQEGEPFLPALVFDLDPSEGQSFEEVIKVALLIHEEMEALHIKTFAKTSGASGLQIFIPLERKYTLEEGRRFNEFFAEYFSKKYSELITIERSVQKRGRLLYFDYLQMWKGKTLISTYSPRAVDRANVSTPITWEELERGMTPSDFNLLNIVERVREKGDLFRDLMTKEGEQNIDFLNEHVYTTWNKRYY